MRTLLVRLVPLLLRLAMDPGLRRALPLIYARLDGELGFWVQEALGAAVVQGRMASAISDAIGQSATQRQLALVRLLYDPVQAAGTAVLLRSSR
jgi:hypothetical protein